MFLLRRERFHGLFSEVLIERVVARRAGDGLGAGIAPVRLHRPALLPVSAQRVKNGQHALARFRRDAFDERLNAAAGVAVEKIAGADENALFRTLANARDTVPQRCAP